MIVFNIASRVKPSSFSGNTYFMSLSTSSFFSNTPNIIINFFLDKKSVCMHESQNLYNN